MNRHITFLYWALAVIYFVAGINVWELSEAVLAWCYGACALTHVFIGTAHLPGAKINPHK